MDIIKIMIVDKQIFFRIGLCQVLSQESDLELLDCDPADNLTTVIETESPDVILLGIYLPSHSELKLGRNILWHYPNIGLIMLGFNLDDGELFEVIKTGAAGYLNKNTTAEELASTIRQVHRGQYPINDVLLDRHKVADHVLRGFQNMASTGGTMEGVTTPLTHRETEILNHIAEGKSNKKIAHILDISEQTIKNHVSSILRKLNANDRAHAAVLAIRNGWISAENKHEGMVAVSSGN